VPKIIRALSALMAILVVAFAVGACGGDDGDTESPSANPEAEATDAGGSGNAIVRNQANTGKTVVVGSKNFAEQYILGEIYAQALEAAGFEVERQLDLGSEQIAYKALKSGRITAYPEYTGTALTSFYRVQTDEIPRDPQESYDLLKERAAEDGITAMPQTPFQNTFVITSTVETAEKLGNPKTLSELAEKGGSDVSISGFPECRQRTDCLLGLRDVYDWTPKFVSSQGKFEDLDQGQADLTFGFGTDGELALDKYYTYEDDKQLFPPYYITFMVNEKGVETLGENGQAVIEQVQEQLTEEVMQELNSRVTIDKEKPADVAATYLSEAGYVQE
jgi:glycine betaine/choline ABC-type transport system substrate-binding protein